MPMFPELDSMIVVPGLIAPDSIPYLMILRAGLSFVLPPGLSDSNLAHTRRSESAKRRFNLTSGVRPMAPSIPSFMLFFARRLLRDSGSEMMPPGLIEPAWWHHFRDVTDIW